MSEREVQGPTGFNTELVAEPMPMPTRAGGFVPCFPGIFMEGDWHMRNGSSGVHIWDRAGCVCLCVCWGVK